MEKVHVRLGLSGTYWGKRPQYRVLANDVVIQAAEIAGASEEVEFINFDFEYNGSAVLAVELTNKEFSDTVENEDKTAIVQDMLLNIVSVEIDEIDLGSIPRNHSIYTTYDNRTVDKCVNLGWNGTWRLRWTEPFYLWLLENM